MEGTRPRVARDREGVASGTVGTWYFSTMLLLLLGGIIPLVFTRTDIASLSKPPVLLSIVITEWASLRLVTLLAKGRANLVQITFWVFVYVWLGLTALAQTVAQRFPIPGPGLSAGAQSKALIAVLMGLVSYEAGLLARRSIGASSRARWFRNRQVVLGRVLAIAALGGAGAGFALWNHGLGVLFGSRYAAAEAVYGQASPGLRLDQAGNKAVGLLQATFIWAPAFLALLILVAVAKASNGHARQGFERFVSSTRGRALVIGLGLANVLVNNPISSPRYRLGGIALALVAVAWPLFTPLRLRAWSCTLIIGVLFAFPLLDVFRYDDRTIDVSPLSEQLLSSPDFAMFQQEVNAQAYVEQNGFTFGEQVLGVAFGYVPRALWPGKPIDTGNLIVTSDAINASASLWATVFVDGGLLAVAVTFFAYGWITRLFEGLYVRGWRDSSFIAVGVPLYASFQLILLRGDLQPAVGQLAPLLVALIAVTRRQERGAETVCSNARPSRV